MKCVCVGEEVIVPGPSTASRRDRQMGVSLGRGRSPIFNRRMALALVPEAEGRNDDDDDEDDEDDEDDDDDCWL